MQLMVERSRGPLVGGFLDAFAKGAARAGLRVERAARGVVTYVDGTRVAIVWNGRHIRGGGPVVYCEHGWLPRWAYQVSPRGINADSHLAPFAWDGKALGTSDQEELERRLAALRRGSPFDAEYMRPDPPPLADLPSEFLLAPLQIENDTNILRHVPAGLRRMQAFVDEIARANPPLPILFKQHPADVRHGLRHVRLRMRRRQDSLRAHDEGNIHQLLKSGRCRGVVSLNSNVVHDALLWGVPSLVLGRNVWPQTNGPFLTSIPRDWSALFDLWQSARVSACRDAYAWYLIRNQWTREDAENPDRVARLLRGMTGMRMPVRRPRPTVVAISRRARRINIVAANRGWLFEDLKRHFIAARVPGIHVLVGERPRADADAWIFLRAREAFASPDPTRSVVQIHDMADAAAYRPGGDRAGVARCAGLVLTHPDQREVLAAAGVPLPSRHVLVRPLGALRCFSLRADMPDRFTIGWVGRPSMSEDDVKRPEWVAEVMEQIGQPARALRVVLLGERLDGIAGRLADAGVDIRYFPRHRNPIGSYPRRYHEMDCLLVTDRVAAGPNALFEALACGVPVVSTRAGWAPELIRDGENGYLADARGSLAESVMRIAAARDAWFVRRDSIRKTVERWSLEGWLRENLELAARLTADAVV